MICYPGSKRPQHLGKNSDRNPTCRPHEEMEKKMPPVSSLQTFKVRAVERW